jgi:hypothetical protein
MPSGRIDKSGQRRYLTVPMEEITFGQVKKARQTRYDLNQVKLVTRAARYCQGRFCRCLLHR